MKSMKLLIIPKPVMNRELAVESYCFRFIKADDYFNLHRKGFYDGTIVSPCIDVLEMVGLESFTNGLPIFVPITNLTLLTNVEQQFLQPPNKVIFLLNEKTLPESHYIEHIKKLKKLGYCIALDNISDYKKMKPIIELCDFIFISCANSDYTKVLDMLNREYTHLSYVATDVNDMELFEQIKNDRFNLFEGKFYCVPITKGNKNIAPVKANRVQLLNIVRNEDFEIADVVKIVLQDPSLSISLLKFVNSPYLGLAQKISTIQHAASMMGQSELRKWVTTAISNTLALDKPNEISKLSLMRAKFAENLAGCFEMGVYAQSLFLMGLFSILDVALDVPMKEALKVVTVSDNIYNALVYKEGSFSKILDFILTYESANWEEVYKLMILNNLEVEEVFDAYINAVGWYGTIIAAANMEDTEIVDNTEIVTG